MKKIIFSLLAATALLPLSAQTIQIEPQSLEANVNMHDTAQVITVIRNIGIDTLHLSFPAFIGKGSGGPDDMGYSWKDSDEEGGPNYEWEEISATGTPIAGLGDDVVIGPFNIGFDFSFYGQNKNQFWVSSNGAVGFNHQALPFYNSPIPTNNNYIDFIAWFWDDLTTDTSMTRTYYKSYENRLVIQFEKYVHYPGSTDWITAEMVIFKGGDIIIRYKQVLPGFQTDNGTIGLQSYNPEMGLQVVFNAAYLHPEMAIRFDSPAGFIHSVSPSTLSLAPGHQEHVRIIYHSEGFETGTYQQDLKCQSNDPLQPEVLIQNTMHVVNPVVAGFKGYVTDASNSFAINDVLVKVGEHSTHTNGNGYYELPLEPGSYNVEFSHSNYQTFIVPDTTAIDGFSPLNVHLHGFCVLAGRVWAGDSTMEAGFAYCYKMNAGDTVVDISADMTGGEGWFEFPGLEAANYIVKAEPSPTSIYYNGYLPTYYGDVIHWEEATTINLLASSDNYPIHLVPLGDMPVGPGVISGNVTNGSDYPVSDGIPVILRIQGTTNAIMLFADASGNFEFTNLGFGTYELFAEIPGKAMVPMIVTLNGDSPSATGISMIILPEEIVFGTSETQDLKYISQAFPNPAIENVNIMLNPEKPMNIEIGIIDITGSVLKLEHKMIQTSGVIKIDISHIPSGVYSMKIITDNKDLVVRQFIKMK
jgi:hypothetical protein